MIRRATSFAETLYSPRSTCRRNASRRASLGARAFAMSEIAAASVPPSHDLFALPVTLSGRTASDFPIASDLAADRAFEERFTSSIRILISPVHLQSCYDHLSDPQTTVARKCLRKMLLAHFHHG